MWTEVEQHADLEAGRTEVADELLSEVIENDEECGDDRAHAFGFEEFASPCMRYVV